MKQPANVTVLLSVYNGSSSLERCLGSIASQTFQAFAIVCVDDGSTDNSLEVLKRWQKKLVSRLIILRNQKNIGLTKSLNKGLHVIRTPYTARVDTDDWWDREKLAKQVAFLEQNSDYGVVGCNYINVGSSGEQKVVLNETDTAIRRDIIKRNPFAHSCVVFRTNLIQKLGGYDNSIRYGQDYDLWLRCYPFTKFYNLQEFLCHRTVGRGISVEKQRQQMIQGIKTQIKYIRKYRLPIVNYIYLLELLGLVVTPNFIKSLKRKVFS